MAAIVPAEQRIILAVDTSDKLAADRLVGIAADSGASLVKLGLQLQTATSPEFCSRLAARNGLGWVFDLKLKDIPHTVVEAVKNIRGLAHPPVGITMHTTAMSEAMAAAQQAAGPEIRMLGVTVLTSLTDRQCFEDAFGPIEEPRSPEEEAEQALEMATYRRGLVMRRARAAAAAGLAGVVASPLEVGDIKADPLTQGLFAMIPGIRPAGSDTHDQARPGTPGAAILAGADLLVVGRPITEAPNPALAYAQIVTEIQGALDGRA